MLRIIQNNTRRRIYGGGGSGVGRLEVKKAFPSEKKFQEVEQSAK